MSDKIYLIFNLSIRDLRASQRRLFMSNDLIAMDNSIVTSAYNLSVNEQRLIYCALKQMPKGVPVAPDTPFYITRDDFIELGADPNVVAREIRTATRELMKKSLFVRTNEGVVQFQWLRQVLRYDRNAEQKLREKYPNPSDYDKYMNALRMYNLIDALPTHKADDNIVARVIFSPEIMPLLSDLKASFTQFLAQDVAEFGSIYSYRIYQLFMQYLNKETGKGWTQIDFYDFRYMLMLLDKYPLTADFKKRVIDPAIKEINEKSPLKAKYELIKKGRKFVAVKFTFELKERAKKTKENESRDLNTPDMFTGKTENDKNRPTVVEALTIQQAKKYATALKLHPDILVFYGSLATEDAYYRKVFKTLTEPEEVNEQAQQIVFTALWRDTDYKK